MPSDRSNVLDDASETGTGENRRGRPTGRDNKKKTKRLYTPVKCSMCSATLRCPDSQDPDTFMISANKNCIKAEEGTCVAAVKAPSNKLYVQRLEKMVRDDSHS